jgi:hypothetical protein
MPFIDGGYAKEGVGFVTWMVFPQMRIVGLARIFLADSDKKFSADFD